MAWILAFAGMTSKEGMPLATSTVMPAKAGTHASFHERHIGGVLA
ncbi:hypothetical protein [Hyphomicrobium sp.]|nr:hypothetical protein [Hyphomicrobium sp.]